MNSEEKIQRGINNKGRKLFCQNPQPDFLIPEAQKKESFIDMSCFSEIHIPNFLIPELSYRQLFQCPVDCSPGIRLHLHPLPAQAPLQLQDPKQIRILKVGQLSCKERNYIIYKLNRFIVQGVH